MRRRVNICVSVILTVILLMFNFTACTSDNKENVSNEQTKEFTPTLDTQKEVSLEIAGFLANFEALDQVVNNFNNIYPNVTVTYSENSSRMLKEYMQNNPQVDIIMTSNDNLRYPELTDMYIGDYCYDLSSDNIDFSAIKDTMIENCEVDNHIIRVPIAESISGMVVNKSLLEKEGLNIPTNYNEFIDVLEKLKNKGYTPIQSASNHAYSDLIINMAMTIIGNNDELINKFNNLDPTSAQELKPVFEKLDYIISNGYTNEEINSTYPYDNYDKAILKFFEGDVPFWICTSESVSGMKKRESKSQAFTDKPFEYEFMYVPLGDNGAYKYVDSWNGFSVNKYSDTLDYAVEFIRFLVTDEQINLIASVKGLPSVAKDSSDSLYQNVRNSTNIDKEYVNNGKLKSYIRTYIENTAINLGKGKCDGVDGAIENLEQMLLNP